MTLVKVALSGSIEMSHQILFPPPVGGLLSVSWGTNMAGWFGGCVCRSGLQLVVRWSSSPSLGD